MMKRLSTILASMLAAVALSPAFASPATDDAANGTTPDEAVAAPAAEAVDTVATVSDAEAAADDEFNPK